MKILFSGFFFITFIGCECLCDSSIRDAIENCHKIAANETCPEDYCTYYYRDPGPYLTCCLCEHRNIELYYAIVLVAVLIMLFYELICSPSPLSSLGSTLGDYFSKTKSASKQSSDEKPLLIDV